jgi:hypothetical protein
MSTTLTVMKSGEGGPAWLNTCAVACLVTVTLGYSKWWRLGGREAASATPHAVSSLWTATMAQRNQPLAVGAMDLVLEARCTAPPTPIDFLGEVEAARLARQRRGHIAKCIG